MEKEDKINMLIEFLNCSNEINNEKITTKEFLENIKLELHNR